jgi:hypothetical protein
VAQLFSETSEKSEKSCEDETTRKKKWRKRASKKVKQSRRVYANERLEWKGEEEKRARARKKKWKFVS